MTLLWGFTTSSKGGFDEAAAVSKVTGTLVVAEELVDHKSSSGAKRAAGCATSSDREINVELDAVVLVVLVVVLLARRPPSCLLRRVKTPASFTEPAMPNETPSWLIFYYLVFDKIEIGDCTIVFFFCLKKFGILILWRMFNRFVSFFSFAEWFLFKKKSLEARKFLKK